MSHVGSRADAPSPRTLGAVSANGSTPRRPLLSSRGCIMADAIEIQITRLHEYLAFTKRDRSLTVAGQIERDAAQGCMWAKRCVASGLLVDPVSSRAAG